MIVADPIVPGIEKVSAEEVDYLLLVKTKPGEQYAISRELRRKIKECFDKKGIQPGGQPPFLCSRRHCLGPQNLDGCDSCFASAFREICL